MKINILFEIQDNPRGGGNQFLKALKNYFINKHVYSDDAQASDIILFNSYQHIEDLLDMKQRNTKAVYIHRVDGPIRLYVGYADGRDKAIYLTNEIVADATIFQTEWSKKQNYRLGLKKNNFSATICNAPDSTIFNRNGRCEFLRDRKIKLIATSWSANWKKGFSTYQYLDKNLDFDKYEMTFVGNSPVEFENIKLIPPLTTKELAKELKQHNIFITASQKDPCSNALIEAMHCGLPAVALKDGGHVEIVKDGGEFFETAEEIPQLLDKVTAKYNQYQTKISLPSFDKIGAEYLKFCEKIYKAIDSKKYSSKKLTKKDYKRIEYVLFMMKIRTNVVFMGCYKFCRFIMKRLAKVKSISN